MKLGLTSLCARARAHAREREREAGWGGGGWRWRGRSYFSGIDKLSCLSLCTKWDQKYSREKGSRFHIQTLHPSVFISTFLELIPPCTPTELPGA